MRLLVTLDFPPQQGGIQRYLYSIVKNSYGKADLVIIARHQRWRCCFGNIAPRIQSADFPGSRFFPAVSLIGAFGALIPWWFSPRENMLVEAGNVYAGLCPWFLSLLRRRPYRVYTYGSELLPLRRRGLRCFLLRSVLRRAEALYVLGGYTASLVRAAGVERPMVTACPRIEVNLETLRSTINQRLSASSRSMPECRILSVGRLVPHKGHHILIEACYLLSDKLDNWKCVIVGDGPCRASLMRQAVALGSCIELRRQLSDHELAQEYACSTIFVLPSLETARGVEGFGIVLLEAMRAGCAIIASRTGGVPEVVDDAAVLTSPGDAHALADAIARLASDASLRADLIVRGAERLIKHFSWVKE